MKIWKRYSYCKNSKETDETETQIKNMKKEWGKEMLRLLP